MFLFADCARFFYLVSTLMMTCDLSVLGMKCDGCSNTVHRALTSMAGVSSVDVQRLDNRVTVHFDAAATSVAAMIARIEKAGFTAQSAPSA